MKNIAIILGVVAAVIQLVHFWPLSWSTFFSSAITGYIFYAACSCGRNRGDEKLEQNWIEWSKNAIKGMGFFLLIIMAVLFYAHHTPRCEEISDPLFGGCIEYSDEPTDAEKGLPFNPIEKSVLPILLSFAYYIGNATARKEYLRNFKRRRRQANNASP